MIKKHAFSMVFVAPLIVLSTVSISTAEGCSSKEKYADVISCLKGKGWLDPDVDYNDSNVFTDNSLSRGGTWLRLPSDIYLEKYGYK